MLELKRSPSATSDIISPTWTGDESEPLTSGDQIHPLILQIIVDMPSEEMKRVLFSETLLRQAIARKVKQKEKPKVASSQAKTLPKPKVKKKVHEKIFELLEKTDYYFDKIFFPKLARLDYGDRFVDQDDTDASSAVFGDDTTSTTSSIPSEVSHELKKWVIAHAKDLPPEVNVLLRR